MSAAHEHRTRFDRQAGNVVAFMVSLVAHVSLFLLLACWVYSAGTASHGLLIQADIGQSQSAALDMVQTFDIEPQVESSAAPPASPELALNVALDSALNPEALQPASDLPTNRLMADLASATLSSNSSSASTDESYTTDASQMLEERGYGRGASFFGSRAYGDRFVYVLDSSSSMTGSRWTAACAQLIKSIEQLEPNQEFFVICFDYHTTFLFDLAPHNIKYATKTEKSPRAVRKWLASRTLGNATMPAEALQVALSLNPDAIFLLSDGELQDESVLMLRMLNAAAATSQQIPIHTISLYSREGWWALQQIAADNGGTFTPVQGR